MVTKKVPPYPMARQLLLNMSDRAVDLAKAEKDAEESRKKREAKDAVRNVLTDLVNQFNLPKTKKKTQTQRLNEESDGIGRPRGAKRSTPSGGQYTQYYQSNTTTTPNSSNLEGGHPRRSQRLNQQPGPTQQTDPILQQTASPEPGTSRQSREPPGTDQTRKKKTSAKQSIKKLNIMSPNKGKANDQDLRPLQREAAAEGPSETLDIDVQVTPTRRREETEVSEIEDEDEQDILQSMLKLKKLT